MRQRNLTGMMVSDRDLDFLVKTTSPGVSNKAKLKQILKEDKDFRTTFIEDERVFRRLMDDDGVFLKISPGSFFQILLRKAANDLKEVGYTAEKTSTMKIPVFDSNDVVDLLTTEPLLLYLADMLSSFTKIRSYSISFRAKEGIWRKLRFNDSDIGSLMSLCEAIEDEYRLGFYKRIADPLPFRSGHISRLCRA